MERNQDFIGVQRPLKFAIYARKSTEGSEKQQRSIKDQISDCMELARSKGLMVVGEPITERKSAKTYGKRPMFKELIKRIRSGEIDGVITWHPDRLARNMRDASLIMDLLEMGKLKELEFCTFSFDNSPAGRLSLNILFAVAAHYSEDLSQKAKRGIRKKFSEGGLGGYHKNGYIQEGGYYFPDEHNNNFGLIQEAWRMRADGKTFEEIIEFLKNNNYTERQKDGSYVPRVLNKPALTRMFNDSFYFGIAVQADQTVDLRKILPDFQAVTDERTFAIVQERNRSATRGDGKIRSQFLPFRDCVYCGTCHDPRPMAVYKARSARGVYYVYFKCKNKDCPHRPRDIKGVIVTKAIEIVLENVGRRLSGDAYDVYLNETKELSSAQKKALRNENTGLMVRNNWLEEKCNEDTKELSAVRDPRMKEIIQLRISNKLDEIEKNNKKIRENEEKLRRTASPAVSREWFNTLVRELSENYSKGSIVQKDLIVRNIFSNLEFDGKKITNVLCKEPFASILGNDFVTLGGTDETRTRDLCRDRAAL